MPDGWEYIRLCTVCWLDDIKKSVGEKLPYLDAKTLRGKTDLTYLDEGKIVDVNTKVILVDGENSGEVFDVPFKGYMGSTFKILGASEYFNLQYLNTILDFYKDVFRGNKIGAAIPHLNKNLFKSLIIGLPPIKEQERIVEEIKRFSPVLAEYDRLEQQATKLDAEIYDKLKKSILQYAIQGKLLEQDENDEPASVLLEHIRAEKKAQLGKKYVESYIYKGDDNCYYEKVGKNEPVLVEDLPFDIPDTWAFSRLGDIIYLQSGRDLEPNQYNSNGVGIPYITGASNIENEQIIINRWTNNPVVVSKKGDLLITCKGTIGTMAFNDIGDIHIARQIMAVNSNIVCLDYIRIFLESYVSVLQARAKSMIPGINRDDMLQAVIPIPSLSEQIKIIKKVKYITKMIKDEN